MMVWERMVCQRNFGKLSPQGFPTSCRAFLIAAWLSPRINLYTFAKGTLANLARRAFPLQLTYTHLPVKGEGLPKTRFAKGTLANLARRAFPLQLTYTYLPVKGEGLPKTRFAKGTLANLARRAFPYN